MEFLIGLLIGAFCTALFMLEYLDIMLKKERKVKDRKGGGTTL